ncbi:MAG: hypothetical protein GWP10_09860 [Nitrospiraceae bacterium]|nr:hypothetical protein [Nitrospiraceae bacterium]
MRLNKKNEQGISRREELEQVEKQTGKRPAGLGCQEIPDCVKYLWEWFWEINESRSSNGFGLNPISYLEIQAWNNLTMNQVHPWEVIAIKKMDVVFRAFYAEDSKEKPSKGKVNKGK